MHPIVRLLKLHSHGAHDGVGVGCMGLEDVRKGFNAHVGVDVVGEGGELVIHCFGEFLHDFGEEFFRY